jgi:Ca-activated chloride channel family protein
VNFLNPGALAFAAVIPVVILFYLLKRKRVALRVASTLLWQKFLAETQANAPFQRLRRNWLLILQLLMLCLALLALARPYFPSNAKPSRLQVVLLDASASMKSTDEKPSRFDAARDQALRLVDGMRDQDQMVVLQVGGRTEVKQSATSEKSALRRALRGCAAQDSPTRLLDALKLADTLIRGRNDAEIHLFSDGAIDDLADLSRVQLPIVYHRIGKRGDNAGITALDVRANPDNPAQKAVYAAVLNHSDQARSIPVDLLFDNERVDSKTIQLQPGETVPVVFAAAPGRDGVFTVRLNVEDELSVDNEAWAVSIQPRPVKVLLVTRGNRFLEKALHAANTDLTIAADATGSASGFDLVALDDVTPSSWPETSVLAIHVVNTNWFGGWSKMEAPPIVDWKGTHPLLRYVNFDNVQVAEAWKVDAASWGLPLVETQQGALIFAGEYNRQRVVWIAFDTLQSTWPLRVSFPIFIANAVDWLNPLAVRNTQLRVKAGDPFRLAVKDAAATEAEIIRPDQSRSKLAIDPRERAMVFGDTLHCGVYQIVIGTNRTSFCVNLLDAAESKTKPRDQITVGKFGTVAAATTHQANLEIWRWFAAAGLGVLLFEWWYYHRRTA